MKRDNKVKEYSQSVQRSVTVLGSLCLFLCRGCLPARLCTADVLELLWSAHVAQHILKDYKISLR